jgi:phosphate transport system substrate-binding protein
MRLRDIRVLGLGAWLATIAGCGEGPEPAGGEVVVDGSSTVYRISQAASEAFHRIKPQIHVVVDIHGTGGGFERYLAGEVDLIDASRPAKPEEEAQAKAQGLEWTRFLVGHDGITVVVSKKNDFVKALSVAQLKRLWEPDSSVKTWKDLDPSWPDRAIVLYCPDNASGTFEFFTEAVVGKARSQRKDVQASADDNILVNGVAHDDDGLGYFGYAYYAANSDKLRAVPIQSSDAAKPVLPSPETILDHSYTPLSRPLFVYAKNAALRRPEVAEFLSYYLDHVVELAQTAGYVPPTADERAANRAAWPGGGLAAKARP